MTLDDAVAAEGRIVAASSIVADSLHAEVDRVCIALIGRSARFVSDESTVWDFLPSGDAAKVLAIIAAEAALGVSVAAGDYIIDVALRLRGKLAETNA